MQVLRWLATRDPAQHLCRQPACLIARDEQAHPLAGARRSTAIAPGPGGSGCPVAASTGELMCSRCSGSTGATACGWSRPSSLVRRTLSGRAGLPCTTAPVPPNRAVLAVPGCAGSGSGAVSIGWLVAGSAAGCCGAPPSGALGPAQALWRSRATGRDCAPDLQAGHGPQLVDERTTCLG